MITVLVISYHFPPEGGPAIQRVSKFCKYLPRYGIMPVVLTARKRNKTRDKSLYKDIPGPVRIVRTLDPGGFLPGIFRKLFRRRLSPDRHALWRMTAVGKGVELVGALDIKIILSSSPPHSLQLVAREIADRTGLPWIADFRDEWTRDPDRTKKGPDLDDRNLEQEVLNSCTFLTTITGKARENFTSLRPGLPCRLIRNGFDPDDFKDLPPAPLPRSQKVRIVYCGRFTRKSSPTVFFASLEKTLAETPERGGNLELVIAGGKGNRRWVNGYPAVGRIARFIGYQAHRASIALMHSADTLLLLATNTEYSEVTPSKMYEYFRAGKPVLAFLEREGECADLLREHGNARVILGREPVSLEPYFRSLEEREAKPVEGFINRFRRDEQARALADLMKQAVTA